MCGICGYISDNLIDDSKLNEMNDTMYHRGPNDRGIWQQGRNRDNGEVSYAVGFAQRRLSILDLSMLGHQPMLSDDGRTVITFNGEVYNFQSIRKTLIEAGYTFKSNSDTEVIIYAYKEWGIECFTRFNGMFAIAIYDFDTDKLILARDRMGKKPLYYYKRGKHFVFASELKPIMLYPGFHKNINETAIGEYLCKMCIAAPKTIFEDTYKLEPGCYLVYDCQSFSVEKIERYWDLIEIFNSAEKNVHDLSEGKSKLKQLVMDSVEKRLIADVPVGAFLSGGIDSTLVTAIAKEVRGSNVDTFTIGFNDEERNEAPYAKDIANHLGTNHHEMYISDEEILDQLKDLAIYYDEPFSDSSQIPCMLVSKVARQQVTVALSGDGGDEMFCGYTMYDQLKTAENADFLGALEYHMPWNKALSGKFPDKLKAFVNNRDKDYKTQFFADLYADEVKKLIRFDITGHKSDKEAGIKGINYQETRMILDMVDYIPSDILTKMDRASMKYSLEVRCPLLDHRIPEWSFTVDHKLKYHGKEKKYLLKQLVYDYVPESLLDRPKKGFGVPLRKWVRTVLRPEIDRVSTKEILDRQGIFDYEGITRLKMIQDTSDKRMYAHLLWGFYVFQMWYNQYVDTLV